MIPAVALLLALTLPAQTPAAITVAADARSVQPGEIVVLTITVPPDTDDVSVRAFDRDIAAYNIGDATWQAIVGIDLATPARSHPVTIEARSRAATATLTHQLRVAARTFRTRRLTVAGAFVNPPTSELARIKREADELAALWAAPPGGRMWDGPFIAPVPERANSAFGVRSVYNGELRSWHSGADFPSKAGSPIRAPGDGRVVVADALYFSGNTIVIDHGAGVFSLLAHLSEMNVKRGDEVEAGDKVGAVGATGRVTGPHLHWAVRANGARVDPLSLVALLGPD